MAWRHMYNMITPGCVCAPPQMAVTTNSLRGVVCRPHLSPSWLVAGYISIYIRVYMSLVQISTTLYTARRQIWTASLATPGVDMYLWRLASKVIALNELYATLGSFVTNFLLLFPPRYLTGFFWCVFFRISIYFNPLEVMDFVPCLP